LSLKKILIVILLTSFSFGAGAYYRFHRIEVPDGVQKEDTGTVNVQGALAEAADQADGLPEKLDITGRINILLMGEDNVDGTRRSDTVAFVAVDIDERNMRVLSLPRDTRVRIPGHGNQKLNHAYAYGNADLLRDTVEEFLGTTIHYYVKIDYDNFPKLVDLVGGVDIFVGKPMKYEDRRGHLKIDIPAGKQRMDGDTALKYVRFRKDALGDIGRVQRQQQFLKALLHRMYEPENMVRFAPLAKEITNTLKTDMRPSLTLQLCSFVKKLDKETDRVFFLMLPGTPAIIDSLSYWVAEPASVVKFLNADTDELSAMVSESRARMANSRGQHLFEINNADDYSADSPDGAPPGITQSDTSPSPRDVLSIITSIPEAVSVLNGTGKKGVGQSVASQLQRMGVEVVDVGNAKHFDYRSSNIIYPDGAPESTKQTAVLLSRLCGISDALTRSNKLASSASLIVGADYENLMKRLENSYSTMQ
jgi:LCP family protein required for cell wall assembly